MKVILSILLLIPVMIFSQEKATKVSNAPTEGKIYEKVDQEANFPGGSSELMNFIGKNVKYPEEAMRNEEQGKVFVEFIVNVDGSVSDVKVLRGVSKLLDREAMRVVKRMPDWTPAEIGGNKVRSRSILPINFRLPD